MARRNEDNEDITIIETDGSGSNAAWFVLGAAMGAGLALLFAPQSGRRTRRQLKRRAEELREQAGDKWEELAEEVEDRGRHLKESVSDWAEDTKAEVRKGKRAVKRKAANARDDLERRLEDARARRRSTVVAADGVADLDDEDLEGETD